MGVIKHHLLESRMVNWEWFISTASLLPAPRS